MKHLFGISAVLIASVAFAATDFEIRGTPAELSEYLTSVPGTIRLTGVGETDIEADSGIIVLVVSTEASTLQAAARLNVEIRKRVIEILEKAGIDKNTVKSDRFSSIPQSGLAESKMKSNKVENVLEVPFRDNAQIEALVQVVDSFGEVTLGGLLFEHSRGNELKTEARQKACAEIMKQKLAYEKTLGIRLRVKQVAEEPVMVLRSWRAHPSATVSRLLKSTASLQGQQNTGLLQGQQIFPDYDTDMSLFQTLTYRAKVTVEYYVETGK